MEVSLGKFSTQRVKSAQVRSIGAKRGPQGLNLQRITTVNASESIMSHYIKTLNHGLRADQARQVAAVEVNRIAEATSARDRLVPLDVRLRRLLATVPAEVQREGLSLPTLVTSLKGRRGGTCHTGELGKALRQLGWTRTRCWRGGEAGGFSARWYPPSEP